MEMGVVGGEVAGSLRPNASTPARVWWVMVVVVVAAVRWPGGRPGA